jgi:hypothetical protein
MADEPAAPEVVERTHSLFETLGRGDSGATLGFFRPDAVVDLTRDGVGRFEGATDIRGFAQEWLTTFEEWQFEVEEILDLGAGVVFARVIQRGRPVGVAGDVQQRNAWVVVWERDLVAQATGYHLADVDEARAAAERLAQERGTKHSKP